MSSQVNQEALIANEFNKQYPYDDMNGWDRKLFKSGYQAATKASESEINSLKHQVNVLEKALANQSIEIAHDIVTIESYSHKVTALLSDNERLREALEVCKYDCHTGEVIGIAEKALKVTP